MDNTKVVYRVEDGMERREILATTYQMRNFYRQLGDGFFTSIDIMNYIQHHQILKWCKKGNHLLDVACGRGLLLPLLRYGQKQLGSYTGVDIEPKNATYIEKRVTNNKPIPDNYYPFPVSFVEANVAEMADQLNRKYDLIIYMSSIEHMHQEAGQQSLYQCRQVSKPGTILFLTSPNTPEDQDGYDTQYRAHIYEWKRSELTQGLKDAGFKIMTTYGLLHNKRALRNAFTEIGQDYLFDYLDAFIPNEWLIPVLSPAFPDSAKELAYVCKAI